MLIISIAISQIGVHDIFDILKVLKCVSELEICEGLMVYGSGFVMHMYLEMGYGKR